MKKELVYVGTTYDYLTQSTYFYFKATSTEYCCFIYNTENNKNKALAEWVKDYIEKENKNFDIRTDEYACTVKNSVVIDADFDKAFFSLPLWATMESDILQQGRERAIKDSKIKNE